MHLTKNNCAIFCRWFWSLERKQYGGGWIRLTSVIICMSWTRYTCN